MHCLIKDPRDSLPSWDSAPLRTCFRLCERPNPISRCLVIGCCRLSLTRTIHRSTSRNADLPVHGGTPQWLADRMTRLGAVMGEAIVLQYGRDECLRRLAHPFWFQSFGAVMGMDWHSSGITTSVIGALKRGLTPLAGELGMHVCGGRGRHSRQTPRSWSHRRSRRDRCRRARCGEPARCQGGQRRRAGRLRAVCAQVHGDR